MLASLLTGVVMRRLAAGLALALLLTGCDRWLEDVTGVNTTTRGSGDVREVHPCPQLAEAGYAYWEDTRCDSVDWP